MVGKFAQEYSIVVDRFPIQMVLAEEKGVQDVLKTGHWDSRGEGMRHGMARNGGEKIDGA